MHPVHVVRLSNNITKFSNAPNLTNTGCNYRWMNYLRRKGDRKITLPFKQLTRGADKDSLASYIRLFEPMVIKALKVCMKYKNSHFVLINK